MYDENSSIVSQYSIKYRIGMFLVTILIAGVVGIIVSTISYFLKISFQYILNWIPVFNIGIILIYYLLFAIRPYKKEKKYVKANAKIKSQNHAYYNSERCFLITFHLFWIEITIILVALLMC